MLIYNQYRSCHKSVNVLIYKKWC